MSGSFSRWLPPATVAAVLAIGGLVAMAMARAGVLPGRPWAYLYLACTALGAVAGLLTAVARADRVAEE